MRRSLTWLSLAAALVALAACQDDGKKTTRSCDTDAECEGGVCFDSQCYTSCLDQDQCSPDEFCVTKTSGDRQADVCVTAADYAGCTGDPDCAALVVRQCDVARCDVEKALCYVGDADDGTVCTAGEALKGSCVAGVCQVDASCVPTGADADLCDGVDDDCDGGTDEDYVVTEVTCGIGACEVPGHKVCEAGAEVTQCAPGLPPDEVDTSCDGVDSDCDGETDEEYLQDEPEPGPTCGVGACENQGHLECLEGEVVNVCEPGEPLAADDATCDGVDDDCDGEPDDDVPDVVTTCGVGACAAGGALSCVGGELVDSCVPWEPASQVDVTCDGVDDDCNGLTDDGVEASSTTCGAGLCAAEGELRCLAGELVDTCAPLLAPFSDDYTCDGVDDDCDGVPDDELVVELPDGSVVAGSGQPCGSGACAGGVTECHDFGAREVVLVCSTLVGKVGGEACNALDDDCDGLTDGADPDLEGDPARACELSAGLCHGALRPVERCQAGQWAACTTDDYLAWDPLYQAGVETGCDGYDNDCDGAADEDFSWTGPDGVTVTGPGLACGTGACAQGVTECGEGELTCSTQFNAEPEQCDGVDSDCDGQTDEAGDLPCGPDLMCINDAAIEGYGCVQCFDGNDVRWDGCDFTVLAETQVNEMTKFDEHRPAVAVLDDGGFAITWTSLDPQVYSQHIFGRRYAAEGKAVTGEFQVSPVGSSASHRISRVAPLPGGGFVVLWGDQYTQLMWRTYDGDVAPLGEAAPFGEMSYGLNTWDLAGDTAAGRVVAAWDFMDQQSYVSTVNGQGFGEGAATVWGPEVLGDAPPVASERDPRVAVFPDGHAVVVWDTDAQTVRVRLVSPEGKPADTVVDLVPTSTEEGMGLRGPAVAVYPDGGFVVVYTTSQYGEVVRSLDAQRFTADGKPEGDPVRLDSLPFDDYQAPEVAAQPDGGFVVTFPAYATEGTTGLDVYARWFGKDNTALDVEAVVHTYLPGDQSMARVAAFPDGSTVIAWASCDTYGAAPVAQDGTACGIYQQRFSAEGKRLAH